MVNRTGQGIRAPQLEKRSSVSAVAPTVQMNQISRVNERSGQGLKALGVVLNDVENKIHDRLDIQAEVEGLREGAIAGQNGIPEIRDAATIRGRAYNRSAKDAAALEFDLNSRVMMAEIEQAHKSDPVGIKSKSRAYLNGILPKLQAYDPAMAQQFEANYIARETSAIKTASAKRDAIARDRQMETALNLQFSLRDDLSQDAAEFISGEVDNKQDALIRMGKTAARLTDLSSQIGADGRPLFSARERVMAKRTAQDAVGKSIGQAWFSSQEDLLAGYKTWQDGEATITVKDEDGYMASVNLKEVIGARVYGDVKADFVEKLKSDIAFENQVDAFEERKFDDNADVLFRDLSTLGQDGPLSLNLVEATKSQLKPDQYLTLRELAKKEGPSISDAGVLTRLTTRSLDGHDVSEEARKEYKANNLTQADYLDIYKNNNSSLRSGVKDPITVGRNLLAQNLGNLSKELGIAQSATIGQAVAEYEIEIADFFTVNNRQPSPREARDIAENLSQRFSVMEVDNDIISLPLPQSISLSEKNSKSLSSSVVKEKIMSVNELYLKKNAGDSSKRDSDPEYLRETILLKKYYDRLLAKERSSAVKEGQSNGK